MADIWGSSNLGGGGSSTATLPDQITNLACVGGTDGTAGTIDISFTEVPSTSWDLLKNYVVVYKEGSIPQTPFDGFRVILEKGTASTNKTYQITGLTFDQLYGIRIYPVSIKNQYQTLAEGATATATPVNGIELSNFNIGDIISFQIDGIATRFILVHKGMPSALYSSSFNDATILMIENIPYMGVMTTGTGIYYPQSTANGYLSDTFLPKFTAKCRLSMKTVKIPYVSYTGNNNATIQSGENGYSCELFLPSAKELSLYTHAAMIDDGAIFSYFSEDQSFTRKSMYNGVYSKYWCRTCAKSSESSFNGLFWRVDSYGNMHYESYSVSNGYRFCMVHPDSALISPSPEADGSYKFIE